MIVHIDRASRVPLYEQIANQLRTLILAQGLLPGSRLPSSRELADTLSVNRKTVVQAYRMLCAEGLVRGNGRGGTIVQAHGASPEPGAAIRPVLWRRMYTDSTKPLFMNSDRFYRHLVRKAPPSAGAAWGPWMRPHEQDSLSLLSDAWEDVLNETRVLGESRYSVRGYPPLREYVAKRANMNGMNVPADCTMITDNPAQTTFLLAMALLNRGDSVALEVPCLPTSIHVYDLLGIQIQQVPMDDQGIDLDVLEGLAKRSKVKLIHVSPTNRIPTGTSMSLQRRKDLVDLASRYRVPILEMPEYLTETYEGSPLPSLSALDDRFQTICGSTLESELPMGLRIAWVVAPEHTINALVPIRQAIHPSTHPLVSMLAYQVLTHPRFSLETIRLRARDKRDHVVNLLETHCAKSLVFKKPEGGMHIWAEVKEHVDLASKLDALATLGGPCLPGHFYYPGMRGGDRNLCFGFSGYSPEYLSEAISSIGEILR